MFISSYVTTVFVNDVGTRITWYNMFSGLSLYVLSSRKE